MRVQLIVLAAAGMMAVSACGRQRSALRNHENHVIYRIPKVDIGVQKKEKAEEEGGESEKEDGTTRVHKSVWLAREVWETYTDDRGIERRRIRAIEVLFCPGDKADFTQCRVGVAFSVRRDLLGTRVMQQ